MTGHVSLLVALMLSVLFCFAPTPSVAKDPRCKRGLLKGSACCLRSCGQCGGPNCAMRGKGGSCCVGSILRKRSSCKTSNAPCRLLKTSTRESSTRRSFWRHVPSTSGSLVARHEACSVMVDGKVVLVGGRGFN